MRVKPEMERATVAPPSRAVVLTRSRPSSGGGAATDVTAAGKLGDVHALVVGANVGGVAGEAAKIAGVAKVLVADAQKVTCRPWSPGAGHWVAEQAPEEMLAALTEFLAPYREDGGGLR